MEDATPTDVVETTEQNSTLESKENSEVINPHKDTIDKMLKKHKVKVDGEEIEVDEDEVLKNYQLKKASDKRFQEGMQARKQAEEFIRLLKTDPLKVLSHPSIGVDVKKWAEDFLVKEMQKEMMTPEQKQMEEYKSKLAKYQELEEEAKRKSEDEKKEAVRNELREGYHKQIIGALETSGLPKTEYTVGRMIHYMAKGLQGRYELDASDVVDLVRRDYINDTKALYSNLDADALVQLLGDDVAKKIRKYDLNKVKNPLANKGAVPSNSGISTAKPKDNKMSREDWRSYLESLKD